MNPDELMTRISSSLPSNEKSLEELFELKQQRKTPGVILATSGEVQVRDQTILEKTTCCNCTERASNAGCFSFYFFCKKCVLFFVQKGEINRELRSAVFVDEGIVSCARAFSWIRDFIVTRSRRILTT